MKRFLDTRNGRFAVGDRVLISNGPNRGRGGIIKRIVEGGQEPCADIAIEGRGIVREPGSLLIALG